MQEVIRRAVKELKEERVPVANGFASITDELIKLKQLLDMGVLTNEEFENQKQKLLNT